jgi:hypothetical protein
MKVLFLDIDGVLNCLGDEDGNGGTTEQFQGFIGLDSRLIAIYKAMLSRVDVTVVLSSSWRVFPDLLEYLNEHGVYFHDITVWTDPELDLLRGHEIQLWLNEYPGVSRYAILDDESDHILEHQLPNFFQTSYETGITQEVADRIVAHLTGHSLLS